MDGKMLARIAAVVFIGVAITATAIELTRKEEEPEVRVLSRDHPGDTAPLRSGLRRCRDMGEAATRDPACLKVWAANRDRFLRQNIAPSEPAAPQTPAAIEPAPAEDPIRKESDPVVMQPEPAQPGAR
jgi:conjugative transfer region protein TrbK